MSTIQDYKDAWAKANAAGDQAAMDAAHKGAEGLRAKQGFSGGADGTQRIPLNGGYTSTGSYFDKGTSAQDKAKIDALKKQWELASARGDRAGMDKAHKGAELIRQGYGYGGGTDGSEYNPLDNDKPRKSPINSATPQNDYINKLYEAQREAALAKLKSAYEQNMIDVDAAAEKIPQMYQSARNKTAATSEQNKAAFNERAAAYGLNSGTGGQAALAMSNQNAANMSAINAQEANATNDLETTRLKLSTAYQNDIAQAVATGDLARAQALYNEAVRVDESLVQQSMAQADEDYRYWAANNQLSQQETQQEQYKLAQQQWLADALGKYGVFSGYSDFGVTPEQQAAMKAAYNAANFRSGGGGTRRSSGGRRRGGNSGGGSYAPPPPPLKRNDGLSNVGDIDVRAKVYNMMSGGATGRDIMAAAKSELANGSINQKQYADYQHAVYVAGGKARRR